MPMFPLVNTQAHRPVFSHSNQITQTCTNVYWVPSKPITSEGDRGELTTGERHDEVANMSQQDTKPGNEHWSNFDKESEFKLTG